MDRRVFDMLELYRQNNMNNDMLHSEKTCINTDYCLATDYNAKDSDILTMAFVNMQPIDSVYETEQGFSNGTIFPNIDKPFWRNNRV